MEAGRRRSAEKQRGKHLPRTFAQLSSYMRPADAVRFCCTRRTGADSHGFRNAVGGGVTCSACGEAVIMQWRIFPREAVRSPQHRFEP